MNRPYAFSPTQRDFQQCQNGIDPYHDRNIRNLIRYWVLATLPRASPLFSFFRDLDPVGDCKRDPKRYIQIAPTIYPASEPPCKAPSCSRDDGDERER